MFRSFTLMGVVICALLILAFSSQDVLARGPGGGGQPSAGALSAGNWCFMTPRSGTQASNYSSATVKTSQATVRTTAVNNTTVNQSPALLWPQPWCNGTGPLRLSLVADLPKLGTGPRAGTGGGPAGPPAPPEATGPVRANRSIANRRMQGPPADAPRGAVALRAVETLRVRRLMQEMRVDEAQKKRIRAVYEAGLKKKHELLRERAQLLIRMREMLGSPSAQNVKGQERVMQELVLRYRRIDQDLAETAWDTDNKVFRSLSAREQARYILFNEQFDTELRERIGALKQRGRALGVPAPEPSATE